MANKRGLSRRSAACLLASLFLLGGCAKQGAPGGAADKARPAAGGFHQLFIYDECIGENSAQPDTCLHERHHEKSFAFGGKAGTVYNVTLRVRGLFEPTTMEGGVSPDPAHPYFQIGGHSRTPDYSQWHIDVSEP